MTIFAFLFFTSNIEINTNRKFKSNPILVSKCASDIGSLTHKLHPFFMHFYLLKPCIKISFRKRMSFLHLSILLILSGDVSLNPGPTKYFKIASTNIQSMRNKGPTISDFVHSQNIDLFCMTET